MATSRPDIVFIHPGDSKRLYQSLSENLTAVEPPVWAGLLASYARGRGERVEIIDAEASSLTAAQVAERVSELEPLLVVIVVYGHQPSASTQNMAESARIAGALKALSPKRPLLMVGGHVASLPKRTLAEEECDFVCTGEGFVTVVELVCALRAGAGLDKVRGMAYRVGDQIVVSAPAPLVENLDEAVSRQAWDLLDMSLYRAHNWHCFGEPSRQPYASVYTTLGCPYNCSFCCIQAPFRSGESATGRKANSYRRWTPEVVVDQLQYLSERYGVRHLKFADEMFVLRRDHVEGICEEILRRNLSLNIWAYARVDTVKDDMIPLLKAAGFNWLALGIESGNQSVRKDVGKKTATEQIFATVRRLRDGGINVIGNFIFGLPEDDQKTMEETLQLALELRCDFANFYSTMAYPGSPLYARATEQGWPLPESWSGYSQHAVDALPLRTRHLTGSQVLRFRDQAFHRYYGDPGYLDFMELKFGPSVREGIESMAALKLERR